MAIAQRVRNNVAELARFGYSAKEISRETFVSETSVRSICRDMGVRIANGKWTDDEIMEAVKMREEGKSYRVIAIRTGRSTNSVCKKVRQYISKHI